MKRFLSGNKYGVGKGIDLLSRTMSPVGKKAGQIGEAIGSKLHQLDVAARPLVTTPIKAVGKGILGAGKGTLEGIGTVGIGAGKSAMWGADKIGKAAMGGIMANPTTAMLGIGATAVGAGLLHDADGGSMAQGARDGALTAGGMIAGAGLIGGALGKGAGILGAKTTGAMGAKLAGGAMAKGIAGVGMAVGSAGVGAAGIAGGLGGAMINKKGLKEWGPVKGGRIGLSKFGGIALAGSLAVGAVTDAYSALEKSRMGQHDGQLRKAAPQMNTAGASGDLVFALHRQR